jgi:hypothetical protein
MTQSNLGNALTRLGERENGAERMLQAVHASERCLSIRTTACRSIMRGHRAVSAMQTGGRESGTERLLQAIAVHRNAIMVWA